MESGINNHSTRTKEKTEFNKSTALDNLFWATDRFLDRTPSTLKKIDTYIGDLPEYVSDYLKKYPNVPAILGYGLLSLISVYLSLAVIDALNGIPLLGIFFELTGLAYLIWFGIRYLLFAKERQELKLEISVIFE